MSGTLSEDELPVVFASRLLPGNALERLRGYAQVNHWPGTLPPSSEEMRQHIGRASGLITMASDPVDEDLLAVAANLKVVANMAVGYDNLDLAALTKRGIPAGNTPGVLTEATADLAFGLIIAAARRFTEARELMTSGNWLSWQPAGLLGLELFGSTLGIIGMGRIGQAVARRARGFGMRIICHSRTVGTLPDVEYLSLDELLSSSDVVSLHVALSEQTRGLIGARELGLMKPTALLVNTTRGPVLDQQALIKALKNHQIAGAGLDVFTSEPIASDHPLLALDNCVLTPHIGSATVTTRTAMANLTIDNILAGLQDLPLPHCVNPEVYTIQRTSPRR